jgi:hypothetical protein
VFYDEFELTGVAEKALSRSMVRYWLNFATTGNPNYGPGHKLSVGYGDGNMPAQWPDVGSNATWCELIFREILNRFFLLLRFRERGYGFGSPFSYFRKISKKKNVFAGN